MHLLLKWCFSIAVSIIWGFRWGRYGLPQNNNVLSLFKAYHPCYCINLPRLESCTWGSAARQFLGSESRDAKNATVAHLNGGFATCPLVCTTKNQPPKKMKWLPAICPTPEGDLKPPSQEDLWRQYAHTQYYKQYLTRTTLGFDHCTCV